MKRILVFLAAIVYSTISIAQKQEYKQFAVKSGYVEYELSGNTIGTKKFWWDNFGEKSRTEIKSTTTIKIFGRTNKEEQNSVSIADGTRVYAWDLIKGSAYKTSNAEYIDMGKELTKDMSEAEIEQMGQDIIDALGGERLGTEKILGKTCEVIKLMMAKVWIYKGIPLKSEAKLLGITTSEIAIEIKENINIPQSTFTPDKGIEFQEIDSM